MVDRVDDSHVRDGLGWIGWHRRSLRDRLGKGAQLIGISSGGRTTSDIIPPLGLFPFISDCNACASDWCENGIAILHRHL